MSEPETPKAEPPPRRQGWRRALYWTGGIVGGLVLIALVAWQAGFVRYLVFNQLQAQLRAADIDVGAVEGEIDAIRLRDVAVRDLKGVWARIESAEIDWSPWELMSGVARIRRLSVSGFDVARAPESDPNAPDSGLEWPELPVDVEIEAFDVELRSNPFAATGPFRAAGSGRLAKDAGRIEATATREGREAMRIAAETDSRFSSFRVRATVADPALLAAVSGEARLGDVTGEAELTREGAACGGSGRFARAGVETLRVALSPECALSAEVLAVERLPVDAGGLRGPLTATLAPLSPERPFADGIRIDAALGALRHDDPLIARFLDGATAAGRVTFADGEARVEDLALTAAQGQASASGTVSTGPDGASADVTLTLARLGLVAEALAGSAEARVVLSSSAERPLSIDATLRDFSVGGQSWSAVRVTGTAAADLAADLRVAAEGGVPLDVAAKLTPDPESLKLAVSGAAAGGRIDLTGDLPAAGGGSIQGRVESLPGGEIGRIVGIELAGTVSAEGRVDLAGDSPTVDAKLEGRDLVVEGQSLGAVTATARGPLDALAVAVEGGARADGRDLVYRFGATRLGPDGIRIDEARVTSGPATVSLAAPATLAFGLDAPLSARLAVSVNGTRAGEIAIDARRSGAGWRGTAATAGGFDFAALAALGVAEGVEGSAEARLEFDTSAARADATASIASLRVADAPTASVRATAAWRGDRIELSGSAEAQALAPATASLTLRARQAAPGAFPSIEPSDTIAGSIAWRGRVGQIWRRLDVEGQTLDGDAVVDVTLGGTLVAPRFEGEARVMGGVYGFEDLGLSLRDIEAAARFGGSGLSFTASANDGGGGRVTAQGSFPDLARPEAGTATIDLANLLAVSRADARGRATGRVTLRQTAAGPQLAGRLTVTEASAEIPNPPPPELTEVEIIDPAAPPEPREAVGSGPASDPLGLGLDLAIDLPGPIEVTGRGLDTLWRGTLAIGGDVADPRVTGRLVVLRGEWRFGARTLTIARGAIEFDGGLDPRIDIAAEQEADGFTGRLTIAGRPDDLRISASSDPPLPEDEAFARILFGRSVGSLSALEGLELANSIAALSGGSDLRFGVLDELRGRFGLDVLSVEGLGTDEGASVRAGRYLSDGVYFELRQRAGGGTRARVEIEVTDEISVETEVGPDAGTSAGVRYKLDY